MRYKLIVRIAYITKPAQFAGGDMKRKELSFTVGANVNWLSAYQKWNRSFSKY